MFGNELPRQLNSRFTAFEAHNPSICAYPLRKQIENPLRPTANVDRSVTGSNIELIEKPPRIRCKFLGLPLETFLLLRIVSQEIFVISGHGVVSFQKETFFVSAARFRALSPGASQASLLATVGSLGPCVSAKHPRSCSGTREAAISTPVTCNN